VQLEDYVRQQETLWTEVKQLEVRVRALESLRTPEQHAQLRLIKQAEHVVDVAKAEGQL
jgi:hypothetical protein